MFKLGRGGGGRGGGKRPPPSPLPSRPATAPGVTRLPFGGGGRGRPGSAPGDGAPPPGREESFSLSSSADLDFGAIIRLTPDLIEEIKRVESQGGSARIKFAPNFTIPQGNVIDVGGKEFGFTWSRDELCDIYEERQSGEDGDGLLVECGSAWRKLNVLRTLDESTKKLVKKRSEEAERLHKSRKAIVLPSNPSMKNEAKRMAAAGVEGNMRRMGWKQKKEPFFKTQKVETNQVSSVYPPKSVYKSGNSSNRNFKGVLSVSPVPSPSELPEPGATVSPFATVFSSRDNANIEEITPPLDINKEEIDIGNFEKKMPSRSAHGAKQKLGRHKGHIGDQPVDFHNNQAQRASENSKGTSLKALEKAAGETTTNPMKKNASKIKNIEAPGKYIKSGVEVESSKQRESESGSSPQSAHGIASAIEPIVEEKYTDGNLEHQAQPSSKIVEDPFVNIGIMQDNPDPFSNSDKKISNDNEGKTSSSDGGSDSDSESDSSDSGSDNGSQSRSRSKNRSPARSASASSSDSESDDSSSSKEVSDVDVDIMGEDEKGEVEPKAEAAGLKLCSSPRIRASDGEQEQIDIIGDQEELVASLPIDLNYFRRDDEMTSAGEGTNDFPNNNSVKISENPEIKLGPNMGSNSYRANSRFPEVPFSPDQYKHSDDPQLQVSKSTINMNERVIKTTVGEKQNILNDWSAHKQIETTEKMKTKREKPDYFKEKPDSAKKSKGAREAEVMPYAKSKNAVLSVNSRYISPEKARQDQYMSNNSEWGGMKDIDPQEYSVADRSRSVAIGNTRKIQQSPEFWSSSSVEAEQPGSGTGDASARGKSIDRFNKNIERIPVHPDSVPKDKMCKDTQDERNVGEKFSSLSEYNRKSSDHGALLKDNGPSSQIRKSGWNKSPVISGKGSVLRTELSELELGELREPAADGDTGGINRQSEGKDSFKALENKAASTDSSKVDINKGRSSSYLLPESKKYSPHNMRGEVRGNQEGFHRKLPPDDSIDIARVLQRTIPSQGQQPSIVDHADSEVKCHMDKSTELTRRGEIGTNQGRGMENHVGFLMKNPSILLPQHDIKHGEQRGYKNAKESKQPKPITWGDSTYRSNASMETQTNGRKRRESSTEDDSSFYSKYDKEIPEFRDSIKNFSQYNDYVQEFRDKYDCYISLNKKLENIRNDFLKVGEELELAKGRGSEEYYKVVDLLREMYLQRGERNKQMKRIFIVLHEELKTLKQRIEEFVEMHTGD